MLRVMSTSRNPADRALFLAYAYGKPKESIDVTSGGDAITFIIERRKDEETGGTPSPTT
jgi:hypothetical protein